MSATCLAVVFIPFEAFHAEGDQTEAEDPAAQEANDQTEDPLESSFVMFHLGESLLAARVALHVEGLLVSRGHTVGLNHGGWGRGHDVGHRLGIWLHNHHLGFYCYCW